MDLLEWEVLQPLYLNLEVLITILLNPVLEEELLQSNKHSPLIKLLCLFALLVDLVKLFKIGVLEDFVNDLVHLFVKDGRVFRQLF